ELARVGVAAPGAAATAPAPAAAGRPSRVLVIDDDPGVLDAVARMTRGAGLDVETATSGLDGIARYRRGGFDCVITDLTMPEIGGLTVSRAIKDGDPAAYVVLLTGAEPATSDAELRAAGVDRIVAKPVTREELLEVLSAR